MKQEKSLKILVHALALSMYTVYKSFAPKIGLSFLRRSLWRFLYGSDFRLAFIPARISFWHMRLYARFINLNARVSAYSSVFARLTIVSAPTLVRVARVANHALFNSTYTCLYTHQRANKIKAHICARTSAFKNDTRAHKTLLWNHLDNCVRKIFISSKVISNR